LDEGESEERDDAGILARQIAEYSRFQIAARAIGALLGSEEITSARPARVELDALQFPPPLVPVTSLLRAAKRLLATPVSAGIEPDPWPSVIYSSLRQELIAEVRRLQETTFATLSRNAWHPLVVITMFLALLDAVRMAQLCMQQDEPFGNISVSLPRPSTGNA
jgi:chromatin segregation and condensation protein Rec8/ScpA/Scc1 (kleisin family)